MAVPMRMAMVGRTLEMIYPMNQHNGLTTMKMGSVKTRMVSHLTPVPMNGVTLGEIDLVVET